MGQWITYGEREMNFDGGEKESLMEMRKEYWYCGKTYVLIKQVFNLNHLFWFDGLRSHIDFLDWKILFL